MGSCSLLPISLTVVGSRLACYLSVAKMSFRIV